VSKLYYRYGTMDSSKTARLLMDAHEYNQRGESVLLFKPVKDTRSKAGKIESRVGLSAECLEIHEDLNIYEHVSKLVYDLKANISCIFVDEAQFLSAHQVVNLRMVVDTFNIPVMCYGLKTDFTGVLFEGSKALFEHANRFEEVKTICREEGCRKKAMYNGRFKDGKPVFNGDTVAIGDTNLVGDNYYYVPKCSKHFLIDFMNYEIRERDGRLG